MTQHIPRPRRRLFLGRGAATLLAAPLAARVLAAPSGSEGEGLVPAPLAPAPAAWRNWSDTVSCQPRQWLTPGSVDELATVLKSSTGSVRCVGAGHSFTPLVSTTGTLLSLDRLSGLLKHDSAAGLATLGAGTRITVAARRLDGVGLALMNQPDIDAQTLAGAMATGTHGTGPSYGAMHSEVAAMKLMTVDGRLLSCSLTERADLLAAAQVSLGCLGVVTELTMKVRPRHFLRRHAWVARNEALYEQAPELLRKHQHVEMFFLPCTGYGAAIVHDEVPIGPVDHPPAPDEDVLADLKRLRDWFGRWPALRRWIAGKAIERTPAEHATDVSWKMLASSRPTRFNETESHVPREAGLACVRDVLATLEKRSDVFFPIELRYVMRDGAWLSPFQGRDSCSVAVHALFGEPYDYLVKEIGPVFRRHGGRPHWGKLHDQTPAELAAHYPRWKDFLALRRELDPQGRLLNPYLQRLFGLDQKA